MSETETTPARRKVLRRMDPAAAMERVIEIGAATLRKLADQRARLQERSDAIAQDLMNNAAEQKAAEAAMERTRQAMALLTGALPLEADAPLLTERIADDTP